MSPRHGSAGRPAGWLAALTTALTTGRGALGRTLRIGLFQAVAAAGHDDATAVGRRFSVWRRLFGQAVGIRTDRLRRVLAAEGAAHGCDYQGDIPATLFALHSTLALIARLTAAASLPGAAALLTDRERPAAARLAWVDSGAPFAAAGIEGMPGPDVFDWIAHEPPASLLPVLAGLMETVTATVVEASCLPPGGGGRPWSGDLFAELYQELVPRELRHALGEVYTPPWLAAHAFDEIGWDPEDSLLDPACGSGCFLLEALRRRLAARPGAGAGAETGRAEDVLAGLYGIDLNPLAVQMAKASLVVALAGRFDPARPVRLPVFLACALTLPEPVAGWAAAAADAGAALAIPRVSLLAGNPPWVKWSQLPPGYAAAIKPLAARLGLFGEDRYVGGIEPDVAAAVTLAALARWLKPGGRLAFYLTASLFSTPSGQGFRRFEVPAPVGPCRVLAVEDLKAVTPFAGVSTHPALLLLEAGGATRYPVPYRLRLPAGPGRSGQPSPGRPLPDGAAFRAATQVRPLLARPLPGTTDGPWLKGSAGQHDLWRQLFDAARPAAYRARKGVTADRNGIYFVNVTSTEEGGSVRIINNPSCGRDDGVAALAGVVEDTHLFPLLRGRGVTPFRARIEAELRVLVPQRGMHGDPALPQLCPRTFAWFRPFESVLRARASYRRYQQGQPFWSVWSTGPYSFAPWKVLWREISSRFCAAYLGPVEDAVLGVRVVVPDHKLYFVPAGSEEEAAYLTGLLNAPAVVEAVSAVAAALSLGAGVIETLRIPRFDPACAHHQDLSALARHLTRSGGGLPDAGLAGELDRLALALLTAL